MVWESSWVSSIRLPGLFFSFVRYKEEEEEKEEGEDEKEEDGA